MKYNIETIKCPFCRTRSLGIGAEQGVALYWCYIYCYECGFRGSLHESEEKAVDAVAYISQSVFIQESTKVLGGE